MKTNSVDGNRLIRGDLNIDASAQWQLGFEIRQQRQRKTLNAMLTAFKNLSITSQLCIISNFPDLFQTNMDKNMLLSIYQDVLKVPQFTYGKLPGYYTEHQGEVWFHPDYPSYKLLLNQITRSLLINEKPTRHTVH